MRLDDLLERKEAKQLEIIKILMDQGGTASIKELSEKATLSKASIMTYLSELQQVIADERLNCLLTIHKDYVQWSMALDVQFEQLARIFYQNAIQIKILLYLLKNQEYSVVGLANKLSISESTLARKIKEMNQVLAEFDLMIWQGKIIGEELQIRYFYYLLRQKLEEFSENGERSQLMNKRLVEVYERAMAFQLDENSRVKLDRWITVCKYRQSVPNKEYTKIRSQMEYYQKDPLYQKMRLFIPRALMHYAGSIDNEEAMIQFVALLCFNFLPEESIYQYSLERSRFTPTALVDTIVTEKIVRLYQRQFIRPKIESAVYLALIQIHFQLFFLKGEIEWEDLAAIWKLEETYAFTSYHTFVSHQLNQVVVEMEQKEFSKSQLAMAELKYLSLIRKVDQSLTRIYRIGVSLKVDSVFKEAALSYFQAQLSKMTEVVVEPYNEIHVYDLVVANHSMGGKEDYLLSGVGNKYDFEQIYSQIKQSKMK